MIYLRQDDCLIILEDFHISKKSQLLKDFDRIAERARKIFVSRYSEDFTNVIADEVRREYEALIPQIPYIGNKQPLTRFIISTAQFPAMYRVLKRHRKSVEETGKIIYEICELILDTYPVFVLRFLGRGKFSRKHLEELRKLTEESPKT